MWVVATTLLVVSSETARSGIEEAFAWGAGVVADHHWSLVAGVAGVAIACIALTLMTCLAGRRPKGAPPVYSEGMPVLGNLLSFSKHPLEVVKRGAAAKGNTFTMRLMGKNCTFMIGPKAHTTFFAAKDNECDTAPPYLFMKSVFGKGVVYDAPLDVRVQQLKFASMGLKSKLLANHVPLIEQECRQYFREEYGKTAVTDVMHSFSRLIILTASRALMGPEVREHLFADVARLFADLDKGITPLSIFWPEAPTPAHRRRNKARIDMANLFAGVMKARRASGRKSDDILQVIMDSEYRDGTPMPDEHVSGIMIAMLFAGQHTSSITSSWSLLFIVNTPGIMERVMAEQVEAMLGAEAAATFDINNPEHAKRLAEAPLTFEKIEAMTFLAACMKEAIRMNPPIIYVMREAMKDITTADGKFTIPKGDTMFASPAISMRTEEAFTNPDTFDPDRFARGEGTNFAYIGFGGGVHACMGERFAFTQIRTILSTLLRNYAVEAVSPGLPSPDFSAMVVPPKHGDKSSLRFTARKLA